MDLSRLWAPNREPQGFGVIELLLVGVLLATLAFFFLKTNRQSGERLSEQVNASGGQMPANVDPGNPKQMIRGVQENLDAVVEQQNRRLQELEKANKAEKIPMH